MINLTPLLTRLARLRTAAVRFAETARAEAYSLAEAGDNAASLKTDGEADQLENLTYDITDLIDRLAETYATGGLAQIETDAAAFTPAADLRTTFAQIAGELETDRACLQEAGGDSCSAEADDLDSLIFMLKAIARRK